MENLVPVFSLLAGLLLGALIARLLSKSRASEVLQKVRGDFESQIAVLKERLSAKEDAAALLSKEIAQQKEVLSVLQAHASRLEKECSRLETALQKDQEAARKERALLDHAQAKLSDAFKALSAEALKSNNQMFLEIAKSSFDKLREGAEGDLGKKAQAIEQMVQPVRESLDKFDSKIQEIEKARIGAYEGLSEQVKSLLSSQQQLRSETRHLVNALRKPQVRGRWGELQLKRVVELAGMMNHCDFYEQASVPTEEGMLRPDLIVKLPGGKTLVVDSKVPLSAYLEGIEANDEADRALKLQAHVRHIREHISALSRKSYWEQFEHAPEFVVLFLPGEGFFSAALQEDPSLIELGVKQRVIIATPTTLIALLKAAAYGWKQENMAENAKKISDLGKELYARIQVMSTHFSSLGKNLKKTVGSYNDTMRSLESRFLPSARRFQSLGVADEKDPITALSPVDLSPRQLQAPELAEQAGSKEERLGTPPPLSPPTHTGES